MKYKDKIKLERKNKIEKLLENGVDHDLPFFLSLTGKEKLEILNKINDSRENLFNLIKDNIDLDTALLMYDNDIEKYVKGIIKDKKGIIKFSSINGGQMKIIISDSFEHIINEKECREKYPILEECFGNRRVKYTPSSNTVMVY